jgi:hypothetical protein
MDRSKVIDKETSREDESSLEREEPKQSMTSVSEISPSTKMTLGHSDMLEGELLVDERMAALSITSGIESILLVENELNTNDSVDILEY